MYVDLSPKENTPVILILNVIKTNFMFVIHKKDKSIRYFSLKFKRRPLYNAVAQFIEALFYKPEGCGFDSRW
jgi:hypothetical protein